MTTIETAKHIQEIIGLAHLNVSFKVHNSPFKHRGKPVLGLTHTYTDGSYLVEFVGSDCILVLLHELAHVIQESKGERFDCCEADFWAEDMNEWVLGELG